MKTELQISINDRNEMFNLKEVLLANPPKDALINEEYSKIKENEQGGFLEFITIALSSTVVAETVKGIFAVIKSYIDLQTQNGKWEAEKNKVTVKKGDSEFSFTLVDEKERKDFFEFMNVSE